MKWMYCHKDLGRQVNTTLISLVIFLIFYFIFEHLEWMSELMHFFKLLCLIFVAYLFVFALLLTKRWIDKTYK
jgi:hypothetical protein